MSLNVTIPDTFNGPLDLLLHLIRRDEMDIHDIPIARLTKSYLEEIRRLDVINPDEAAEFLDLASRLLDIKSRMLLPKEETGEEEEEEDDFDPRSGLVERLLEYRRFKDAAKLLGEMAEEQAHRFPRVSPFLDFVGPVEDSGQAMDGMELFAAFQSMIIRMVPEDGSDTITYTEVPTSIRIEQIDSVLREVDNTRFSLLLSGRPNRREMVGFFIAMLEMIRQGKLVARQSESYADIILERRTPPSADGDGQPRFRRRGRNPAAFPPCAPQRRRQDFAAHGYAAPRRSAAVLLFSPAPQSVKARRRRKYTATVSLLFPPAKRMR